MPDPDIVIAGAGIAGLTAALALARQGFSVTLLEKRAALDDQGAGIQLSPNASRVLLRLGLGGGLGGVARAPSKLEIRRTGDPRSIVEVPLQFIADRHGAPYWTLLRADLQQALREALLGEKRVEIMLGVSFKKLSQDSAGVSIEAEDAKGLPLILTARVFIGADGLWSEARRALGDASPPRFTGREAWRGMADVSASPDFLKQPAVFLWLGPSLHCVHYRAGEGGRMNVVLVRAVKAAREGWSSAADKAEIEPMLASLAKPLAALLGTVPQWQAWPLYDRPADYRVSGRAALTGDAAHSILPFHAQGAALAIEDAAVLAQLLKQSGLDAAPAALRAFARLRRARAARVQFASRLNGGTYHLGGFAAAARDTVMQKLGPERLAKSYDWLYGWKPPGEGAR